MVRAGRLLDRGRHGSSRAAAAAWISSACALPGMNRFATTAAVRRTAPAIRTARWNPLMYDSLNAVANPSTCSGESPRAASSLGWTNPWDAASAIALA